MMPTNSLWSSDGSAQDTIWVHERQIDFCVGASEKKHTYHSFPIGLEMIKGLKLPQPSCNHRGSTGLRRVNLEETDQIGLTKPSMKPASPLIGWMDSSLDWILHLTLCGKKFSSYLSQLDGFLLLARTRILGSMQAGCRIPNFRQYKEGN